MPQIDNILIDLVQIICDAGPAAAAAAWTQHPSTMTYTIRHDAHTPTRPIAMHYLSPAPARRPINYYRLSAKSVERRT